ncbi:MAG: ribose-phosphate pyrophosphokinase [Deltaproteobacteria bacterium]|nr:ribose-phosphate pyrophosphokinase [Deltaproteobacteria bacterium]
MGDHDNEGIKIFTGTSNTGMADDVARFLETPLGKSRVTRFSDGEIQVEIQESVRGMSTFVLQSTSPPANEHLMEMLVMIDALKRASADEITAVIPYYGYARQDRKVAPRAPITAKLVADLISTAGATRVISMDLHAGQIQGFFDVPFDHLYATPVMLSDMRERFGLDNGDSDVVIVAPDAGGVERARAYAKRLQCGLAIIDKRRTGPNVAEVMNIIGDVDKKRAIIIDDMVDTAGTLVQAARAIVASGAKDVWAYATHAVLSGPAIERIDGSPLKELVVTDTIALRDAARACKRIRTLSVAPLVAEAIKRVHTGESISTLFA